jgi:hypothetical protein
MFLVRAVPSREASLGLSNQEPRRKTRRAGQACIPHSRGAAASEPATRWLTHRIGEGWSPSRSVKGTPRAGINTYTHAYTHAHMRTRSATWACIFAREIHANPGEMAGPRKQSVFGSSYHCSMNESPHKAFVSWRHLNPKSFIPET